MKMAGRASVWRVTSGRRLFSVAAATPEAVVVEDAAFGTAVLPRTWLHDNRPEALNVETLQRDSDAFGEPGAYPARLPSVAAASVADDASGDLALSWSNGDESHFPQALLRREVAASAVGAVGGKSTRASAHAPAGGWAIDAEANVLWDRDTFSDALNGGRTGESQEVLPRVGYQSVMETDEGCYEWLEKIRTYGFCLLDGCPKTEEEGFDVGQVAERTAHYVRNSVFGGVWRFENNSEHADTAYNASGLPLHTDGCYCADPPGLQMLHCVHYEATGGMSVLADGFKILTEFKAVHPVAYELLCTTPFDFTYRDVEKGIHLRNATPVVVGDPVSGKVRQMRFNDCDRDAFAVDTPVEVYQAWDLLTAFVKADAAPATFQLTPGTAVVFDNLRVLHARTAFTGTRRLVGCYMNAEDFASRHRVLAERVRQA